MALAKHTLTGKIAEVSQETLDLSEYLVPATDEDVAQVQREKQIKVYGVALDADGDLPDEVLSIPNDAWTKAELIAYAEHKKISVDSSMTKAEILKALQEGTD